METEVLGLRHMNKNMAMFKKRMELELVLKDQCFLNGK